MRSRAKRILPSAVLLFAFLHSSVQAQQAGSSGGDLVQKARNPLADLVSVQVQPNFNFGVGQNRDTEYVVNLQPNVPIHLPGEWSLITRTIVPLLNEPPSEPGRGYTFGAAPFKQGVPGSSPGRLTSFLQHFRHSFSGRDESCYHFATTCPRYRVARIRPDPTAITTQRFLQVYCDLHNDGVTGDEVGPYEPEEIDVDALVEWFFFDTDMLLGAALLSAEQTAPGQLRVTRQAWKIAAGLRPEAKDLRVAAVAGSGGSEGCHAAM